MKIIFLIMIMLYLSCKSYQPIQVNRKYNFFLLNKKNKYRSLKNKGSVKTYHYNQVRYFKIINGSSPIAKINNKAVESGMQRNYYEAKILLEQIISQNKNLAAINNNMGLICELLKDRQNALDFYNRACMLEPGNEYYQNNFLNCED